MFRITLSLIYSLLLLVGYHNFSRWTSNEKPAEMAYKPDSLKNASDWPKELSVTHFSGSDITPSPACLAVAATGEVFVGVDKIGSLGKEPGKGCIIRLTDSNHDGRMDGHTEFAAVDNPRGILTIGNQVFVLHTTFDTSTGLASGMDLVVFTDKNKDGIADGLPQPLITNMSSPKFLQSRGTDHATNGIRMGIDGWIYIAVGDFGFHNARGRDGKTLTMQGGGIVRVRPNGEEMEVYTHGMRNIYDVAIDPFMNIFTRGNTNDGAGWNVRFSHHIQSGEYGYPILFKYFTEEILPALQDLGGGSGTGALFMNEPNWPQKYNNVPMMADWGKSQLFIHRVTADGASFTQKDEPFIKLAQITDLDIDGSGQLFLSAWDGAGYSGSPDKGFVVRAVPNNWKYQKFPDLNKASIPQLISLLTSNSSVARLNAQQELLTRGGTKVAKAAWKVAADSRLPLYARVAAIFTYSQAAGAQSFKNLIQLSKDQQVTEFALRALADRKKYVSSVPIQPFLTALNDVSPRIRAAAIIGLGRLGRQEAATALLSVHVPPSFKEHAKNTEGPHSTPNSEIIPAHLAVRSLLSIGAEEECLKAIGGKNSTLALWTLRYIHSPRVVDGLINAYHHATNDDLKKQILTNFARLYKKEAPYDGQTWWSTRPDGHGPYYNAIEWESSPAIKKLLLEEFNKASNKEKQFFAELNAKHLMGISELGGEEIVAAYEEKIDLQRIMKKKGKIAQSSIEDILLAVAKMEGDPQLGKALFAKQGCKACHSIEPGEQLKGPFMGQIGSIMNKEQIAESILKPNASISQGFATVLITTRNGKSYMGFVTGQSADKLYIRDLTGQVTTIKTSDITGRKEMDTSMMPEGLANSLSYKEFASLVTYLSMQK